jgi:hypothetical protein
MGVIFEFNLIHDVHFKVMTEIRNQWKKMSLEEKAPFKEQVKTHFTRYQQQRVKSLAIQEKDEVEMISLYV